MNARKFLFLIGILALLVPGSGNSQDVSRKLTDYLANNLQEKIYVHTDKNEYLVGEALWMKLYCVDAVQNKPLDLSKVSYVELVDYQNVPAVQMKFPLENGFGKGKIDLPVTMKTGNYTLRAYTNWMKNAGAEVFFEKDIVVINSIDPTQFIVPPTEAKYDIQFFPEGGHLVEGIRSVVGFRMVDQYGEAVEGKGAIVTSSDTIVRFSPARFGLGKFEFTPQAGRSYTAVINTPEGHTLRLPIPEVQKQGYVLQLSESAGGDLIIGLEGDKNTAGILTLVAHNNKNIVFSGQQPVSGGKTAFRIDRESIPAGITYLTVFDANERPLCQRLYYKRQQEVLPLEVSTNSRQYGRRDSVSVLLTGDPAHLSMSVYRWNGDEFSNPLNIVNYLWLVSEIGSVPSPDYYIESNDPQIRENLDILMLTHGWRQFKWERIDNPKAIRYLPEFEGHLVSGHLTSSQPNATLENHSVFLSVPGSRFMSYEASTDKNGRFLFNVPRMYDTEHIALEPGLGQDPTLKIVLDKPFFENYTTRSYKPVRLSQEASDYLTAQNVYMQAQNIFYADETYRRYMPSDWPHYFSEAPSSSYVLDEYTRFPMMSEIFIEFIPYARFRNRGGERRLEVMSDRENGGFYDNSIVTIDGIRVTDHQKLYEYNPLLVEKITIYRPRYIQGDRIINGLVAFSTPKKDYPGFTFDSSVTIPDYKGLQSEQVFFSPVYRTAEQKNSRMPDFRDVMYWNPSIRSDGNQQIQFYSSDLPGDYVIVVEGLSDEGKPGYATTTIHVE